MDRLFERDLDLDRRSERDRDRFGDLDGERLPRLSSINLISRPFISFPLYFSIAFLRSDEDLKHTILEIIHENYDKMINKLTLHSDEHDAHLRMKLQVLLHGRDPSDPENMLVFLRT